MKRNKKRTFITISLLIFFAGFFVAGEILFRMINPQTTYSALLEMVGSYFAPSDFNKLTLKKNYLGKSPSMEYPGKYVTIRTNSLGLRNDESSYEKPNNKKRILIIGDSYTFGVYVENRETYPHVLGELFKNEGLNFEVINAGYAGGFEADEQYVWLRNVAAEFNPDVIIYGFFIGNDVIVNEKDWILDTEGYPISIDKDRLLVYVDEYGRLRNKNKVIDNQTVGYQLIYRIPVLRESHLLVALGCLIQELYEYVGSRLYPSDKYATPPGYSVAWFPQIFGDNVNRFKDKYKKFYEMREQSIPSFEESEIFFHKIILGMNKTTESINSKFIVLMIPVNFQVEPEYFLPQLFKEPDEHEAILQGKIAIKRDYFQELEKFLDKNDIRYINLLNEMRNHPGKYYPRNVEVHFNPEGHKFAAQVIFDYLTGNHVLATANNNQTVIKGSEN